MTVTTKRFLGQRKVKDPTAATAHARRVVADWETLRITTALGVAFTRQSRVVLVRPGWMPDRLYRILLRSIVVEAREAS